MNLTCESLQALLSASLLSGHVLDRFPSIGHRDSVLAVLDASSVAPSGIQIRTGYIIDASFSQSRR
jgi:hypothetical protein